MPEGLPHAAGTVHHANQPEHFAAALQGGAFEFSAKPGAGFVATLRLFQLGGFFIQHARIGPHQSRSALLPGLSTLLVPLRIGAIPPEVNGRAAAATDLLLVAGGAEFGCSASAPLEWAAVVLPPSLLRHWQEALSVPARAAGGVRRLAPARQAAHHLAGALSYAIHLAEDLPEFLLPTQANEAIGTALGEALADCMASACLPGLAHPRAGRDAWRVTNGVDAVLASRLDQPICTRQLCAALGISARKLH